MAREKGLKMAIANPSLPELMAAKHSADALLNHDHQAAAYIAYFTEKTKSNEGVEEKQTFSLTPADNLFRCILEGNKEDVLDVIKANLVQEFTPEYLVHDIMIPAINHVGSLFEEKRYFLPQLLASAETMKLGMAYLEPFLNQEKSREKKGLIIITTVEGDIHDIGKNIVALLLGNYGYRIIDLGKDVPARVIVSAIKEHNPDVVALSALMTTTMVRMKEVIDLARKEGEGCPFIVGGAVVTSSFAGSIGAYYAKDGVEAGKVVEKILRKSV
jgi:5-methyltetrahydrofolate--homocysteine methyltransferase